MNKKQQITVKGIEITVIQETQSDYISLTDMIKAKDGNFFIEHWLRNRNTIEFLSIWEKIYNPNFNCVEFDVIKSQAGLNSFKVSVKEWAEKTNAIGLIAKTGRYGGTYAHSDIAFEFGSWISAEFKLYFIREFQRLKREESSNKQLDWNLQRTLAKINYKIHTDAIKESLVPATLSSQQKNYIYADEADLLNVALFGNTAKQWREKNQTARGNIRDIATLEQLIVLSNLESINAILIHQGISQPDRLQKLNEIAIMQMRSLLASSGVEKLKLQR